MDIRIVKTTKDEKREIEVKDAPGYVITNILQLLGVDVKEEEKKGVQTEEEPTNSLPEHLYVCPCFLKANEGSKWNELTMKNTFITKKMIEHGNENDVYFCSNCGRSSYKRELEVL